MKISRENGSSRVPISGLFGCAGAVSTSSAARFSITTFTGCSTAMARGAFSLRSSRMGFQHAHLDDVVLFGHTDALAELADGGRV